ncbi:MAG: 50S ribosomal protein L15 [Planctomycetota bacterium]|jgi:large subunit ribosomal protein L15|nr:50S ribosomal protein L15 [Planctomycetota bacterium]
MNIHDVNQDITKYKKRKRIGRGTGSGWGKTSARGHKGQLSRSGSSSSVVFEGGRMPLVRRIPKRGFNNRFALKVVSVNVGDLQEAFRSGSKVTPESLKENNLAKQNYDVLKILGDGELNKKLTVSAHRFSASAREKIEKAGGSIVELPGKKPVVKNKQKPPK